MNDKIGAILLAAGKGSRMEMDKNKVFMKIDGKPVVYHSISKFAKHEKISQIIVVCKKGEQDIIRNCIQDIDRDDIQIVFGGKERQDSVYNGLCALDENIKYVMVHDSARPFVSKDIIDRCIRALGKHGSAVTGVYSIDTIKVVDKQTIIKTLDRSTLINVQTPQCFEKNVLIDAHHSAQEQGIIATDESALIERLGKRIHFVKGEYSNIKITTKSDLPNKEATMKIGHGEDVHAFTENRKLILGGIDIPHTVGLAGHSDADVLTHAVMDSLLGAAGLSDIGNFFPDNDAKYKDISSLILLKKINAYLKGNDYTVGNIDCTIKLQEPKISKFIPLMRQKLADTLQIPIDKINIKATTTENLGFVGKKQGAVATAVCLLNHPS